MKKRVHRRSESPPREIDLDKLPNLLHPVVNGNGTMRDTALVQAIAKELAQGRSQRSIATAYRVSRVTIAAVVRQLEERGDLKPLKQRLSGRIGEILDVWSEDTLESIRAGEKKLTCYDFGVLYDRKNHMEGEPSLRVDVEVHGPNLEDLKRLLAGDSIVDVVAEPVATGPSVATEDGTAQA